MALGDILKLTVHGRLEGQETVNVLHYQVTEEEADLELSNEEILMGLFLTNVMPSWYAAVSNNWTHEELRCQLSTPGINVPDGPTYVQRLNPFASGQRTGDALPSFVSAVITKRSLLGGRRRRGRMYVAGISESDADNSLLDNTPLSLMQTLAGKIDDTLTQTLPGVGEYTPVIYSRVSEVQGQSRTVQLTSATAQQQLGTTRSRKIGRGR